MKYSTCDFPSYSFKHRGGVNGINHVQKHRESLVSQWHAKQFVMDVDNIADEGETVSLLKVLALGDREIDLGKFRDAERVFDDLDLMDQ